MPDYVKVSKTDDWIGVWFYNENDKPFAIGEKMCEINEYAYMNGYNWDAYYGTISEENEKKARRFAEIIVSLIENEDELYRIVRENGDDIEWD